MGRDTDIYKYIYIYIYSRGKGSQQISVSAKYHPFPRSDLFALDNFSTGEYLHFKRKK